MISVIIPIYNAERYLKDCIDSVIKQSYSDLEIILIDDGSTDTCSAICDEYKTKDSRIVVVHKDNGGISDARNIGINIAKGEYIGFVDSDDFIHPRMYEYLVNALTEHQADVSTCNHTLFLDGSPIVHHALPEKAYSLERVEHREDYLNNFLKGNFTHYVWKSLYKRAIFKTLRFIEGKRMEDVMFCCELSRIISKRVTISDKLYYYRIRNDSIMHANPMITLEHISAMKYNINHFIQYEDTLFAQKYIEFVMSHILTGRIEKRVLGTLDAYVDKESFKEFQYLYDKYGSSRKSHYLARYFPTIYNILKTPKVKKHLTNAKKSGVPIAHT